MLCKCSDNVLHCQRIAVFIRLFTKHVLSTQAIPGTRIQRGGDLSSGGAHVQWGRPVLVTSHREV